MELGDFLLARMAETEATARVDDCTHLAPLWTEWVLAQCEAVRQAVAAGTSPGTERVQIRQGVYENRPVHRTRSDDLDVGAEVLYALALPYADHPDFDPGWKV